MNNLLLKNQTTQQIPNISNYMIKCSQQSPLNYYQYPQTSNSYYQSQNQAEKNEILTKQKILQFEELQQNRTSIKLNGLIKIPPNMKKEIESNDYSLSKRKNLNTQIQKNTLNSLLSSSQQIREQAFKREEGQNILLNKKVMVNCNRQLKRDNEIISEQVRITPRNNCTKFIIPAEIEKHPIHFINSPSQSTKQINNQLNFHREDSQKYQINTGRNNPTNKISEKLIIKDKKLISTSLSNNEKGLNHNYYVNNAQGTVLLSRHNHEKQSVTSPPNQIKIKKDEFIQYKDRQQSSLYQLQAAQSSLTSIIKPQDQGSFFKLNKKQNQKLSHSQSQQSPSSQDDNNNYNNSSLNDDNFNEFLIGQSTFQSDQDKINSQSTLDSTPILKSQNYQINEKMLSYRKISDKKVLGSKVIQGIKKRELHKKENQNNFFNRTGLHEENSISKKRESISKEIKSSQQLKDPIIFSLSSTSEISDTIPKSILEFKRISIEKNQSQKDVDCSGNDNLIQTQQESEIIKKCQSENNLFYPFKKDIPQQYDLYNPQEIKENNTRMSSQMMQNDEDEKLDKLIPEFNYKMQIWNNIIQKRSQKVASKQQNETISCHQRLPTFSASTSSLTQCKVEPATDFSNVFQFSDFEIPSLQIREQEVKQQVSQSPSSCLQIVDQDQQVQNQISISNSKERQTNNDQELLQKINNLSTISSHQMCNESEKITFSEIIYSSNLKSDQDKLKEAYRLSFGKYLPEKI